MVKNLETEEWQPNAHRYQTSSSNSASAASSVSSNRPCQSIVSRTLQFQIRKEYNLPVSLTSDIFISSSENSAFGSTLVLRLGVAFLGVLFLVTRFLDGVSGTLTSSPESPDFA
jgi:hypothetical protein